jgi:hypothetical protein
LQQGAVLLETRQLQFKADNSIAGLDLDQQQKPALA